MNETVPDVTPISKHLEAVYAPYALLAAMQLDVFSYLEDHQSATDIAAQINVDAARLEILLYALVAAELLEVDDGKFINTPTTSYYLVKDKPAYIGDLHFILDSIWKSVAVSADTIRIGKPQAKVDYQADEHSDDEIAVFKGLFSSSGRSVKNLMKTYNLTQHRHLIDIGGGSAGATVTLINAYPQLKITLLDLPGVIPLAEKMIEGVSGRERIQVVAGNAVTTPIQGTYDAALMRAVTQVLAPDDVRAALKNAYDALEQGGYLYLVTRVLEDNRVEPKSSALFNLVFINIYDDGQSYTESQYRQWLDEAGFTEVEVTIIPGTDAIIRAKRSD